MVLLVFRSQGLHDLLWSRFPGKSYFSVLHPELQGYWRFFGRVDLAPNWFFHAPVPRGTTEHNADFKRLLHEAAGAEFDVEFKHIGFWDLRFAVAQSYQNGRVMLAGDAAHSHPPYGGYGVNTGFEDARNLGWKLAAALQGWGGEHLLDSYDAERRPVFASTIRDFIAKSIETDREFLASYDPQRDLPAFETQWRRRASGAVGEVHAFEPHYEGSPVVCGPAGTSGHGGSAMGSHQFAARAGHHLAPAALSTGPNVFEAMGEGFTLLAFGAQASRWQAFVAAAGDMGLPLTVVQDTCEGERERYQSSLVLVRPDQFVAWTGEAVSAQEALDILRQVSGVALP